MDIVQRFALLVVVYFSFALIGCGQPAAKSKIAVADQSAPTDGYSILFTRQRNNNDNIHLITADGEIRQITDHASKDSSPMLSPDGRTMVFTSERVGWWKIWVMDVEKQTFTQLTNAGQAEYGPYFSADGQRIVFVSDRGGNSEIYLMDRDGKNQKNLTNNAGDDSNPFWGTDDKIYYSTEVAGTYQIARMNPDGTGKEVLTQGKGGKYWPQLSPDTKRILFYGEMDGNPEIYLMNNAKDAKFERLTNDPLMDLRPRWSPDGKKIVFERGDKKRNQHIFLMDADGNNQKQLTTEAYNYAPAFASNTSFLRPK